MRVSYWIMRYLAQWIFILYGRGRVFGIERVPRRGAVLLASSHQSYFDPVIAAMPIARECHFMARDTLFRNPWFRRLIVYLNAFPVRRGSADVGAIRETLRRLKAGGAVVTFPEATRTRDGRIRPLQPGVISVAKRAHCPLVPTIIEGAFEIWPRSQLLPGRAPIWVLYGEPIQPEELKNMTPDEAAVMLTRRMWTLHNHLRRMVGRTPYDYDMDSAGQAPRQAEG